MTITYTDYKYCLNQQTTKPVLSIFLSTQYTIYTECPYTSPPFVSTPPMRFRKVCAKLCRFCSYSFQCTSGVAPYPPQDWAMWGSWTAPHINAIQIPFVCWYYIITNTLNKKMHTEKHFPGRRFWPSSATGLDCSTGQYDYQLTI